MPALSFQPSTYIYVLGAQGTWVPFGGVVRAWRLTCDRPVYRRQQINHPDIMLPMMEPGTCHLNVELTATTDIPIAPLFHAYTGASELVIRAEPPSSPGEMIELCGFLQQVENYSTPEMVTMIVDFTGQLSDPLSPIERLRTLREVQQFFDRLASRPALHGIERVDVETQSSERIAVTSTIEMTADSTRRRIEFEDE